MKNIKFRGDKNLIKITGRIQKIDEYVKYIPRPLISCEIESLRKRKSEEHDWQSDFNRLVIFDNENFHKDFKAGDRISCQGEIQSRNYTRDHHEVPEMVQMAIENYIDIWDEIPATVEPKGKYRQPVAWDKLLQFKLIKSVPEDSMYKEDGTKQKTSEAKYVYRIDVNGEVYKESEHVAYEVLVFNDTIKKLEDEPHPIFGDFNKVTIEGEVVTNPRFDMKGKSITPFTSFKVQTESSFFDDRAFYNNIIAWSTTAEDILSTVKRGNKVKVYGRLQSRTYNKTNIIRWKTPSGRRKKKEKEIELVTREISVSQIYLCN